MNEVQLDYPFSFGRSADGKYLTTLGASSDYRTIWKNRILLVLGTRPGERVMRPDFGSNLYSAVFEPEATAAEIINDSINQAFSKWLPDLILNRITPTFDPGAGLLSISLIYALPTGEVDSVTINTGIFNRSGDLIQEINNG
ncbi:MAG: hypothetical protein EBR82_19710 [Caulobacteraceae bacterium]|nr:hypothetical protein [Caulobacteraceae bacterium]